jgi:tetratricopeptide (TPR) repeat protein
MGKILQFPAKGPSKFGFERVRKRRKENADQLGLFPQTQGKIFRLHTSAGPFDKALLLDERNDSGAEEAYRIAIDEGDHPADAYCNLGIIESKAGRTSKAFDCFTKSLQHDARHFESHYNLGNLYFEADNLRMARMHYELAAEIEPLFPNLYFNLGLVLAILDEKKSALDAFVKYKQLAPQEECRKADNLIQELKKKVKR